jgi:hypothetical protein
MRKRGILVQFGDEMETSVSQTFMVLDPGFMIPDVDIVLYLTS